MPDALDGVHEGGPAEHRLGARARDPHTLAHAARQLVWVLRLEPREPGHVEVAARAPGALVAGQAHLLQAELDVGLHGAPRKERELLEDHRGGRAARRQFTVEPDGALGGRQQSRDEVEERGLAAAGAAQPALSTTTACGRVSPSPSGTPTTPASSTPGCSTSAASISAGETHMPATLSMSSERPAKVKKPSASRANMSPVLSQCPCIVARVRSSRFQ